MKTKKLRYKPEFDFDILGISSSENDYKISWLISSCLEIEFIKCDDLKMLDDKEPEEQIFSVFENIPEGHGLKLKIVSNKGNLGYLITELKNIDYFLLIQKEESMLNDLYAKLKSLPEIIAVFKLNPAELKSKEKLLF
jgi:hypothetical protein